MNAVATPIPVRDTLRAQGLEVDIALAGDTLHAVRGIDLHVARGETLCIVGESGCGKSMTALALMGLLPPRARCTATSIRLQEQEIADAPESRLQQLRGDRMAMVFQEPMTALNPAYTIGNQLVEGLLQHQPSMTHAQATARAVGLLETCGIGEAARRLRQYPHQLSGGLRQRVMIAMALMTEPDLLIADEPTTALDATIQAQILDLLKDLQQKFSLAIILITHNFEVVHRIGNRVAVMYAGKIVETGTKDEVIGNPRHPYTRALLSCVPSESGYRPGQRLGYLPGTVPSLVGTLQGCQFRDRCDKARAQCAQAIAWQTVNDTHGYQCVISPDAPPTTAAAASPAVAAAAMRADADAAIAIALKGVTVTYPVSNGLFAPKGQLQALRSIDLQVRSGQALGIVGESGSGKSTLARVMLGLEQPTTGDVLLMGQSVARHGRAQRASIVQPIFQDPFSSLNPRRTLAATIRLPLDIHGIGTSAERDAAVKRMMDLCGLPARVAQSLPSQISGGQRQRVAIASALVMHPKIVICDEPTSALDVSVQAQILNLLIDLRSELNLTYVVISHDLNVIRCLADRVAVMYLGSVVEEQPAQALFDRPAHPYSQMLLSAALHDAASTAVIGEFPNPVHPPPGCAFHPRCVQAQEICRTQAPRIQPHGAGATACHFPLHQA
jgi:peptide/nickel transport system ATP-binding protein